MILEQSLNTCRIQELKSNKMLHLRGKSIANFTGGIESKT